VTVGVEGSRQITILNSELEHEVGGKDKPGIVYHYPLTDFEELKFGVGWGRRILKNGKGHSPSIHEVFRKKEWAWGQERNAEVRKAAEELKPGKQERESPRTSRRIVEEFGGVIDLH